MLINTVDELQQRERFSLVMFLVCSHTCHIHLHTHTHTQDSEIRRVNNLYSDQDFFALKTVKIAIKEHGVLTEESAREKCRKNNVEERSADSSGGGATTSDERRLGGASAYYASEEEPSCSSRDADDEVGDSDGPEYRDISIQSAIKWKHTNQKLLQKLDAELDRVREDNEKRVSNANHVRLTLDTPAFQPIVPKENSYGSCLWRILIVVIVVLMIGAVIVILAGTISPKLVAYVKYKLSFT